jgi:hypothetical protein
VSRPDEAVPGPADGASDAPVDAPGGAGSGDASGDASGGAEAARRRRRAEVFGEVLPESTRDDRDPSGSERSGDASDEWLRSNVPPHHG